jgi:hypothetical protein
MVVSFSPSMFAVSLTLTSLLPIECPIEILLCSPQFTRGVDASSQFSVSAIEQLERKFEGANCPPGLSGPCPFICLR